MHPNASKRLLAHDGLARRTWRSPSSTNPSTCSCAARRRATAYGSSGLAQRPGEHSKAALWQHRHRAVPAPHLRSFPEGDADLGQAAQEPHLARPAEVPVARKRGAKGCWERWERGDEGGPHGDGDPGEDHYQVGGRSGAQLTPQLYNLNI